MIREDGAELERKHVERSVELVRGDEQRRRQPARVPSLHASRARPEILARQPLDDHHGPRGGLCRSVRVRMAAALRMWAVEPAVDDQRLQSRTEDLAQLAFEQLNRFGNSHLTILRSFELTTLELHNEL